MRFAICDDDRQHIKLLKSYIEKACVEAVDIEAYDSGEALVEAYERYGERYDALFMDMEMPGMNGIDTANAIRAIDEYVILVFVTSHRQYMQESFKCTPLRFVLKPMQEDEISEAVEAIIHKLKKERQTFSFYYNKSYVRLYCDDILYCESAGNSVCIVTKDESYTFRMSLNELAQSLPQQSFCRCHKGFLVNLSHLKTVKGNEISLYHSDQVLPVGRTYKRAFDEAVIAYEERAFYQ